jgi:hypothetical protein
LTTFDLTKQNQIIIRMCANQQQIAREMASQTAADLIESEVSSVQQASVLANAGVQNGPH